MANKRPDIYEHNNPDYAFVDSDFVRGGFRSKVNSLTELYTLYADKSDQMKEHSTIIYVSQKDDYYVLINASEADNAQGWSTPFVSLTDIYDTNTIIQSSVVNTPSTYEYTATVSKYIIDGVLYQIPITNTDPIILTPEVGEDRIDVIVLDFSNPNAHKIDVVSGIPAESPVKPTIDSNTQLEVTFVLVKDGTTEPDGVRSLIIYDENLQIAGGEADTSIFMESPITGFQVDFENTEQSYSGSKSIKLLSYPSIGEPADVHNFYMVFALNSLFYQNDFDKLVFHLYSANDVKAIWNVWYIGNDDEVAANLRVVMTGANFSPNTWYQISTPHSDLTVLDQNSFDSGIKEIHIKPYAASYTDVYIDYIYFQGGVDNSAPSVHNSLSGKQGGNTQLDEFYHIDKKTYDNIKGLQAPAASILDVFGGNAVLERYFASNGGYSYDVEVTKYIINKVLYEHLVFDHTLQLDIPDVLETEDRIDVIAVTNDGVNPPLIEVVKGEPSASPLKPSIDLNTQAEVTFVLVKAGTTDPELPQDIVFYKEDLGQPDEASKTITGTSIVTNSTEQSYEGSKSIKVTSSVINDSLKLTLDSSFSIFEYDYLRFWLRTTSTAEIKIKVSVNKVLPSINQYNHTILENSKYGYDRYSENEWQPISIPISEFNYASGNCDEIIITAQTAGHTYYIDNVIAISNGGIDENPIRNHNSLENKQGGNAVNDKYYHLDEPTYNAVVAYAKDLNYPTIAAMIDAPAQTVQVEGVVIRVDDASADTRITFPTGADKVAYYQKLATSTTSLTDDYILNSAPFGFLKPLQALKDLSFTITPDLCSHDIFIDSGVTTFNPNSQAYQDNFEVLLINTSGDRRSVVLTAKTGVTYMLNGVLETSATFQLETAGAVGIFRKLGTNTYIIRGQVV